MRWLLTLVFVAALLTSCSRGPSKRTAEQLAELQKKKEADKKAEKEKADKLEPLTAEVLRLEAPYDDAQALVVTPDGPCPEGLWAFFPQLVPGATPEEKKANEAKRKDLVAALKQRTILVKLRAPSHMTLLPFDAPNGKFVIEVGGTIDCTDPTGHIALAWTDAKAVTPPSDNEIVQNVWEAPPVRFELPMKVLSEAKTFFDTNHFALSARIAFTPGKGDFDKKVKRVAKVSEKALGEEINFGGGNEDWGAGPCLRGQLLGVRVANDHEKHQLFDQRK
jgi:hypothetical protein